VGEGIWLGGLGVVLEVVDKEVDVPVSGTSPRFSQTLAGFSEVEGRQASNPRPIPMSLLAWALPQRSKQ